MPALNKWGKLRQHFWGILRQHLQMSALQERCCLPRRQAGVAAERHLPAIRFRKRIVGLRSPK